MHSDDPQDLSELSPETINYATPRFGFDQGPFAFTYVSFFLSFITPQEIPLPLVHDVIHSNISFEEFLGKAAKIEAGFLAVMTFLITLALMPLVFTISWCCRRKPPVEEAEESEEPVILLDDSVETVLTCRKRTSIAIIFIIFLLLLSCDVTMMMTNQRFEHTLDSGPDLIKSSISDVELFLKDTHVQITKSLDSGFDTAIKSIINDLEDIDILLGEPIRADVAASTGIELAFHTLSAITQSNSEIISRITKLQNAVKNSLNISEIAKEEMEDLQIGLSILQRQCTIRDRPLCNTLRIRGFEENRIIEVLKTLQEDQGILQMRYLGEMELDGAVKNLTVEVGVSKSLFGNFPVQVKKDTLTQRNKTIEQLELIKSRTTTMSQMLTHTITSLLDQLTGTWESIEPIYNVALHVSAFLWGLSWTTSIGIAFILFFMFASLTCNLCNSNVKAAVLLVTCVCLICLASFFVLLFAFFSLTIGGNGEVIICRTLYGYGDVDGEQYDTLGKLFDRPGYFYEHEPKDGILGELLRPPGSNVSIVNVSLASAIEKCEQNQSSYRVFQLDKFVNKTQIADLKQYPKLNGAINSIHVSEENLLLLTKNIQNILEHMLETADLNLTAYRNSINQPTPEKDLGTFIDQMQRVALQIQDVTTSNRMSTLDTRAKTLQVGVLQPLEGLRSDILYQLTVLEIEKNAWTNQVNQTLNHLKSVQKYLEKSAAEICTNYTKLYLQRIKDYLTADEHKVSVTLDDPKATCRPLFNIFDANRNFLCRYGFDSINGLWFCTFSCLLLWCIGTPIALNIITIHTKLKTETGRRQTASHLTPPDSRLINEQSNWGASSSQRPSHMSRQDSVRSVRWEQAEIVFDDEDDEPPSMQRNPIGRSNDNSF
ncbi:prominin-1-A isoform X2 [Hermetia illucens]|uniref:prominin-1-A isoform X2 n=1 Tax=Hermetia illucens TaxID=343691 RepID=UPI0018CC70CB|nr:prominin-1-A isoform X2 [Hermetia illucens]